jgi:hypothetical protein
MNLDAFATLCRIAQSNGVSLWKYRTPKGIGIETAFNYLAPYVVHPDTWKKEQITRFNPDSTIFPGLAGLTATYRQLPRSSAPWVQFVDMAV